MSSLSRAFDLIQEPEAIVKMCGIAGLIHKGKSSNIGGEMTAMLQALKHRGPDSTGYAVYDMPKQNEYYVGLYFAA